MISLGFLVRRGLLSFLLLGWTLQASAQQDPTFPQAEEEPQQFPQAEEEPQQAPQPEEDPGIVDEAQEEVEEAVEEDTPVETRDLIGPEERPEAPRGVRIENGPMPVLRGVGVGSEIAYATEGVLELGGFVMLRRLPNQTDVMLAPTFGYFFMDNFQLTLFPMIGFQRVGGENVWDVRAMVEPSYHVPIDDTLLAFIGIGGGFRWLSDPGLDFILRPRLGLDILVGRSGILKPALFIEMGTRDGVDAGGLEIGYTIMW